MNDCVPVNPNPAVPELDVVSCATVVSTVVAALPTDAKVPILSFCQLLFATDVSVELDSIVIVLATVGQFVPFVFGSFRLVDTDAEKFH